MRLVWGVVMFGNTVRDQNGERLFSSVSYGDETADGDVGWGRTVWSGGLYGFATDVRRLVFRSRASARRADISDYSDDPAWLGYAVANERG